MNQNKTFINKNEAEQISASPEEIEDYNNKVRRNPSSCKPGSCQCCGFASDEFKKHDTRKRQFYAIVEQIIQTVIGLLIRWECPNCGKTFTDYPDFALPYKRYTVPTILTFSGFYTEDDQITYQGVNIKMPVAYQDSEKQMSHSTIYRWVTDIGNSTEIIQKSVDIILQADPMSKICRDIANLFVPPKKYRSDERLKILSQCRQFLKIQKLFNFKFGVKIFPNFDKFPSFQ